MLKVLHRTRGVWFMKCSYVKLQKYITHVSWDWECGRSEERVWSRVTDLWCIAWVMMFTTPFHHPSPNNTWNSQNYISLAILCKIFTFSLRTLTPPFLAPCAFSCACAQKKAFRAPGLVLEGAEKEAGVQEACLRGRVRVSANVAILWHNVLMSLPSFQQVQKSPANI